MRARMSASVDSVGFSVVTVVTALESCGGSGDDAVSRSPGDVVNSREDVVGLILRALALVVIATDVAFDIAN
jgi:uncharacterized membrane protein YeiH